MGLRGPTKNNCVRRQTFKRPDHPEIRPVMARRSSKVPAPPAALQGEEARAEWVRIAKELHAAGLLPKLDLSALENYCRLTVLSRELSQDLEDCGIMIKSMRVGVAPKAKLQRQASRPGPTASSSGCARAWA